mgnify:CR=1 FL=1
MIFEKVNQAADVAEIRRYLFRLTDTINRELDALSADIADKLKGFEREEKQDSSPEGVIPIDSGGTGATTAQAARTNLGAAAASHNHSATDITSGTLPAARGGTGAGSVTAALASEKKTWNGQIAPGASISFQMAARDAYLVTVSGVASSTASGLVMLTCGSHAVIDVIKASQGVTASYSNTTVTFTNTSTVNYYLGAIALYGQINKV